MRRRIKLALYLTIIAFVALNSTWATAQTYTSPLQQAIGLYNTGMYSHALEILQDAVQKPEDGNTLGNKAIAEGYILLCKFAQQYPNMEMELNGYLEKYPHSPIADNVRMGGAAYLFNNGKYADANALFAGINPKSLDKKTFMEYQFKKGYCHFRSGELDKAQEVFKSIKSGKYYYQSIYYQGYIHYMKKEFEEAIPHFEKAQIESQLATSCKYHILESKFMLKDYNYVNTYGPEIYSQMTREYAPQTARILSESHFATNQPSQAQYYYELYTEAAEKISANDNFYAGMIAYTLKSYEKAIESFVKVATTADSIGQSAYYHMGQ